MKGASGTTNIWKLRLQLMKPVTWIPLIWGVVCGAAASGNYEWRVDHVLAAFACMLMSGPLLAGFTQTINDYYDREIDAINEPYRPIPSGAIPLGQVKLQIWVLLLAGLGVSYGLDRWAGHTTPVVFLLALGGSFVSYIYSAPPLKLKQNGWLGNYALGASYIALPWWAGQALFGHLTWTTAILTLAYSLAGLGIAVVNDFKSVEGDLKMGIRSLPVQLGRERAARVACLFMLLPQLVVIGLLVQWQLPLSAAAVTGVVLAQTLAMKKLLSDPKLLAPWYNATGVSLYVLGMMGTAIGLGGWLA